MVHAFGDTLHNVPSIDVLKIGNVFFMFYRNTGVSLSWAYSPDGINWTNIGVAIAKGVGGTWDDEVLGFPHLYHSQGNVYITYQGISDPGFTIRAVGLAAATIRDILSGTIDVAKYFLNPIIDENNPGTEAWDGGGMNESAIIQLNDTFYYHYAAFAVGASTSVAARSVSTICSTTL